MSLRNITDAFLELFHDLSEELPEDIEAQLTALEADFADKAERCIHVAKRYEYESAGHQGRIDWLTKELDVERGHREALANRGKRLREYVLSEMRRMDIESLDGTSFRFFRVRSSQPGVVVDDVDQLPQGYYRRQADRTAIKKSIKAGEEVPGAHLGDPGVWLEVK